VKAADLFRDIRRAYVPVARGEAGVSEVGIVDTWASFDLLVIDEFHQRGETAAENNLLVNLLDRRYDQRLCTILIANQSVEEFSDAVGDSVVSRINETGEIVPFNWPSYRKPGNWKQTPGAPRREPSGAR
jgi:DNA replication protein DnaC